MLFEDRPGEVPPARSHRSAPSQTLCAFPGTEPRHAPGSRDDPERVRTSLGTCGEAPQHLSERLRERHLQTQRGVAFHPSPAYPEETRGVLDTLGQSQYLVTPWAQESQVTKDKGNKGMDPRKTTRS